MRTNQSVNIRRKRLRNGTESLYLDIYRNRKRRYRFLGLYLIPERTRWDKQRNKITWEQAEAERAREIINIQAEQYEHTPTSFAIIRRWSLATYIRKVAERKGARLSKSRHDHYLFAAKLVEEFGDVQLGNATREYFTRFLRFLSTYRHPRGDGLYHPNTQRLYIAVISTALNEAVRLGVLPRNKMLAVDADEIPKKKKGAVQFLTAEEVKALAETICERGTIKRAFLFSCFCGLRISDIRALKWKDIKGGFVQVVQQKTRDPLRIPLSENARAWLPPRPAGAAGEEEAPVFPLLPSNAGTISKYLQKWADTAGVNKRVTFHVSRHTCATLLLTFGADLYTVSKILGHSGVQVTQIYGEVVDAKREAAVQLVPALGISPLAPAAMQEDTTPEEEAEHTAPPEL